MLNAWAWFLFFASFYVFFRAWRQTGVAEVVLWAGLLGIASHHVLSCLNVLTGPFFFTQYDAYFFHDYAKSNIHDLSMLQWSLGSELYRSFLTVIYSIFGASLWLGQSISILLFAFSLVVLMYLAVKLKLNDRMLVASLLLFSLVPSSLMFGAYTLRETFFTFFLLAGVYASYLALFDDQNSRWKYCFLAVVSFILMGLFHVVLLVYAICISAVLVFLICWEERRNRKKVIGCLLVFISIVTLFIFFPALLPISIGDNYFAMLDIRLDGRQLSIPEAIYLYHQSTNESVASTQYAATLVFSTWLGMIVTMIKSYAFYLAGPFTGPFNNIGTYVLLSEAIIRIIGLCSLVALACRDKRWVWLFFVYVSLTFYGISVRLIMGRHYDII